MSLVTVNDSGVSQMKLTLPRTGAWAADIICDSESALTGEVTISINNELDLVGTVRSGGIFELENTIRVVAGAAGLNKPTTPRYYANGVQARTVINDLLSDAGESLSGDSALSLLNFSLDKWTTIRQPVGRALQVLMFALDPDAIFRILPEGDVFFGIDSFPDFDGDADVLDLREYNNRMLVGALAPTLLPGVTLGGKRISYVEHTLTGSGSNTVAYYDA